jgi:uncharacterized membrane protein
MDRFKAVYVIYLLFFVLLVGLVFITPILAFDSDASILYNAFTVACHQKLSRSLCLFNDGESSWIADCIPQEGEYIANSSDKSIIKVETDDAVGFKMPVCSRDIGLYLAMLIGGLIYPLARRLDDKTLWPSIFLILALVPIGLDGGVQLISDMGIVPFVYESTNAIRLITGGIAGLAAAFYAIPVLINMVSKD